MRSRLLALAAFTGVTAAAAAIGRVPVRKRQRSLWYLLLKKPSWRPPRRVSAPVWTSLYGLIAVSGWRVWITPPSRARSRALALWRTQLALTAAWPWIFFGAKRPKASLAELGVLVPVIALYAHQAHRVSRSATWLVAPYLGWTTFATALNAAIVRDNA